MDPNLNFREAAPPSEPNRQARTPRHWSLILALTIVVLLAHAWVTYEVSQQMADLAPAEPSIQRMEASYVTEIKQSTPPVAAAIQPAPSAQQPAPAPKRAPKAAKTASAPDDAASAAEVAEAPSSAQASASAPDANMAKIETPAPVASEPDASTAVSAAGPVFIWPKATKVTYKLEGYYRGPFYGQATVEWVRQNQRYQVRLDVSVPVLGGINMISEGQIVATGLSPERYESVNRLLFKTSKPSVLKFEEQEVILNNGDRVPRLPDVQDPVSLLIHLAYRFIKQPQLLEQGNTIEIPLASSKRSEVIAYDVVEREVLKTGMGDVATMHVKPRRLMQDKNSLLGDIWFAPSLQYLPIRVYAKWGEDVYVDMQMDGAPQQTPGDPYDD
jgi:hypothetical protein